MKIYTPLMLLFPLLIAACSSGSGPDVPDDRVQVFNYRLMKIYADTDHTTTVRPITITTEVTPLVSGKGRITMDVHVNGVSQSWEFLEPVKRLVVVPVMPPDTPQVTNYPVEFTANERLAVPWKLQLHWHEHHMFFSYVFLDSVFIADSGRYFSVWSHEARSRTPNGYGYNDVAAFENLSIDP